MASSFAMVRNSLGLGRCPWRALVLGAALVLGCGCSSGSPEARERESPAKKTESAPPRIATGRVGDGLALRDNRVEAFPGTLLVVPVGPEAADGGIERTTPPDWKPSGVPEVALVTNEPLGASVWRVRGRPAAGRARAEPWLPTPFQWSAQTLAKADAAADEGDIILWFLAIEMPERPVGRWLRVGGRKLPLEWVAAPRPVIADHASGPVDAGALARLRTRIGPDIADPFRGWRTSLVGNRFPTLLDIERPEGILGEFDRQMRDRALAAIARIRALDASLGDRVVGALSAVVASPDRELLPAWPTDPAPAMELIASVLREDRTDADIRADAAAFLATAPEGIAWVVDEAGADGPSTAPTCSIGIAERWGLPATASLAPLGVNAANAVALKPFGSAVLSVDPGYPGAIRTTTLTARSGSWSSDMRVLAGSVGAKPPGVTLGPLLPDWTQATWLSGNQPKIPPESVTVAMLQRKFDATGVPEGWEIIIEAQRPPAASGEPGDAVTIWLGAMGSTTAAIRVTPEGEATIIVGDMMGEPLNVAVNTEPSRWIAQLTIPPELIATQRLRLGVERIDARGIRSAWPRPMLPGQSEPGRIAIDLTSW